MELNNIRPEWFDNAAWRCSDRDALPPNLPPPISPLLSLSPSLCLSLSLPPRCLSVSFHLGSYLTHEASGLDEHGEVQEAFLNGNDASQGKKEYLL